ncbi:hypothetical protein [Actinomadura sp. NTSP31]|uniref:hypothetical protein n=1 Tax=Actinomadura sp. NTSP31 TaxID=1735447 RepID=UPI0035C19231
MTINELPHLGNETATIPDESITTPPDDVPPSISLDRPTGPTVTGTPANVTVFVDHGTAWQWRNNTWNAVPAVAFNQMILSIQNYQEIHDQSASVNNNRVVFPVTFPNPGTYTMTATGVTTGGTQIHAQGPVNVPVAAPSNPAFTWVAPANGAPVDLGPNGGQVTVELATGTDQLYPFNVSITRDGVTTMEQYSGTRYLKTIALGPTPAGSRSITVTCADPGGRSTTQTRTVVGRDSAPPTVTIDHFDDPMTVASLPFEFVVTGRTPGALSGVTGVSYAFTNGPQGAAVNTGPGGDWSTWRANVMLPTTGTFPFTITATDTRGGTASASSTITLHL